MRQRVFHISQRRIQVPAKYLRWNLFVKLVLSKSHKYQTPLLSPLQLFLNQALITIKKSSVQLRVCMCSKLPLFLNFRNKFQVSNIILPGSKFQGPKREPREQENRMKMWLDRLSTALQIVAFKQLAFTCLKSTILTLEKSVKYGQG